MDTDAQRRHPGIADRIFAGTRLQPSDFRVGKAKLPDPAEVDMKPCSCQLSKAELEDELDMPGWSPNQVRNAFVRPFVAKNS